MPNIKTFDAPQLGLRPSEVGVEAAAGAARRVQGLYNQRADALTNEGQRIGRGIGAFGEAAAQQVEHAEISHGSANMMGLINSQTNAWNETAKNADPNDTTIKDKFVNETLNPALEQFEGSFTTQRGQDWARARVDQFRQHMNEKTSADMSSLAADAVHMNVNKSVNLAINTVSNDPSSLDFLRGTIKGTIGDIADSSPNLTPQANAKVKGDLGFAAERELVHAAISATIAKGGDWKAMADDPKNAAFINRAELNTLDKAAKTQQRADLLTQKQLEDYQHTQQVRDGTDKLGKAFADNVTYGDDGNPIVNPGLTKSALEVARQNPAVADHARTLISWGEAQLRAKKETWNSDATTKQTLYDGLFRPDNPTTEVDLMKAQVAHKLSNQDFAELHQLQKALEERPLRGPVWQGTMEGVKGALGSDPVGHEQYAKFVQTFIPDYIRLSRAGTLPPNALDVRDPESMISKAMAPYKRAPMQQYIDRLSHGLIQPGAGEPNIRPGESSAPPIPSSTKSNPVTVKQNGHTFQRQPDGKYKAID